MAQKSSDNKKLDFSNLPRGAIGIKGLPVSRNTRLPSIRSPRDLTLGAPPKRTFMPNIPAKREKKPVIPENNAVHVKQEIDSKNEVKDAILQNERGHGRTKKAVIQTGGIFSEGLAGNSLPRKEKVRESYHKSDFVSVRGTHIKKEKEDTEFNTKKYNMYRDDFIDDGDDDVVILTKPTIFPIVQDKIKKEATSEVAEYAANIPKEFDQDIAKEVGFDVNRVAQFIKKEKGVETEEVKTDVDTEIIEDGISKLLNPDSNEPQLLLLQFPSCINVLNKMDYSQSEGSQQAQMGADSKVGKDQKLSSSSISSLPEGSVGKLQIMKSGRVRLAVGSLTFELGAVHHLNSKHELVSIKTENNSGDLNVLGYIQDKLIFDPDVDNLLT